jgi:hypothetical protein
MESFGFRSGPRVVVVSFTFGVRLIGGWSLPGFSRESRCRSLEALSGRDLTPVESLDTLGGVGVVTRRPPASPVIPQAERATTSPIISPAKAIKQSFETREECAGPLVIPSPPHQVAIRISRPGATGSR